MNSQAAEVHSYQQQQQQQSEGDDENMVRALLWMMIRAVIRARLRIMTGHRRVSQGPPMATM